jgi:leader peptidase (prepilin peptidase)/N-methyltransferase
VTERGLQALVAGWAVLTGAVIGSFLNVVIARLPAGESVVRPRSRCPGCKSPIAWYDNVPVVSFLLLRARCRRCRQPISWEYPLVELLAAVAAWLAFRRHGLDPAALAEFAFLALLLALTFIDLHHFALPFELSVPLLALALLAGPLGLSAVPGAAGLRLHGPGGELSALSSAVLGAAVGGGFLWLVWFVAEKILKKEAMGLGDAVLLAGLGAWLGLRALLPILLLASIQGSVVGIALELLGKGQKGRPPGAPPPAEDAEWIPPRHSVPFGPFLAAAALEWLYLAGPLCRLVPILEPFR